MALSDLVTAFTVAVTVGLGETPVALKVIVQLCDPAAMVVVFTEAPRPRGVFPPVGSRVTQAQSDPSDVLNANPLVGLVLVTPMFNGCGAAVPIV